VYPNPTQGTLIIDMKTASSLELQLMNTIGQTILVEAFDNPTNTIHWALPPSLQSGIYVLILTNEEGERYTQLIDYRTR